MYIPNQCNLVNFLILAMREPFFLGDENIGYNLAV